jgi:SAM-dependent methyltransferase
MKKALLLGCGSARDKRLWAGEEREWEELVTLDVNPAHQPDVVWDLMDTTLPFADDSFDEIHAYEVLEHTGAQGDYKFFFRQWSEFWRIMKPGGLFFGTVPQVGTAWAFGDPSHTRVIQKESLGFLDQRIYDDVGKTSVSDFRYLYRADFGIGACESVDGNMKFVLHAIKPSRVK